MKKVKRQIRKTTLKKRGGSRSPLVNYQKATAKLKYQTQKTASYQKALLELMSMSSQRPELAFKKITEIAARTLKTERVSIWFFNPSHSEIYCEDLYLKNSHKHEKGLRLRAKDYPRYFRAISKNLLLAAHDAQTDPRTSEFTPLYLKPLRICSMMDIAIRLHGKVLGVICHEHVGKKREWSSEDQDFATTLANLISLQIESHERKLTAIALQESQARFALFMQNSPTVAWIKDTEGRIVFVNQVFTDTFKISTAEAEGKTDYELWPHKIADQFRQSDALALQGKKTLETYERAPTPDGKMRDWRVFKFPLKSGKKYFTGGMAIDVTDLKLAQETLEKQKKELERSNKELEQFAYTASHDLYEPLYIISAYIDQLQSNLSANLDEKARYTLERITACSSRMRQLIEDILQVARINTRGKPFQKIHLEELVRTLLQDLDLRIQENQATVEMGPLPEIYGDLTQIKQLFQNLISNALKFRKKDTPLLIKISQKDQGSEWAKIEIKDNGIGIEKEFQEKIFEPFHRLHPRSEYEGNGIGLTLCERIVKRHGGKIEVSSKIENGSSFWVTLPLYQKEKLE